MENFITGHLLGKNVDVYCGADNTFRGTVIGCSDGVLTLETRKGLYTHVAIDKIVAIWADTGDEEKRARKKHK